MNHKIIRKVQHLIFVFFALFKLNINNEIRKKEYPPLAMVSPTRNDFRFVWPLNRPAAISKTTNKPGSVPRLVPSYNHQISPDKQDRALLVLIFALTPTQHNLCILTAMAAATTTQLTFFPLVLRLSDPRRHHSCKFLSVPTQSSSALALRVTTTTALGSDMLGDFGARDPFPAELESGFGEKVLGNVDTEHKILIPKLSALSLAEQDCSPASPFQTPMSADDAKKLLKKVIFQFPIIY